MQIIYDPSSKEDSLDTTTVRFKSPADKLLRQKDLMLAGMRNQSNYRTNQRHEWLKWKKDIEAQEAANRRKIFQLDNANNKLVAKALLKNIEIEKNDIKTRAANERRRTASLQAIIGAGKTIAQSQVNKQKAAADEKGSLIADIATVALKDLGPDDPTIAEIYQAKDRNQLKKALTDAGLDPITIASITGTDRYTFRSLMKQLKNLQADSVPMYMKGITSGTTKEERPKIFYNPAITADRSEGPTLNWDQAIDAISNLEPGKIEQALFQLKTDLKIDARERFGLKGNLQAMKAIDKWFAGATIGTRRRINNEIKQDETQKENTVQIGIPFRTQLEGGKNFKEAWGHTLKYFFQQKPDNIPGQEWGKKLGSGVALMVRDKSLSTSQARALGRTPVYSKDKNKEVPFKIQFPDAWDQIDRAVKDVKAQTNSEYGLLSSQKKAEQQTYLTQLKNEWSQGRVEETDLYDIAVQAVKSGNDEIVKWIAGTVGIKGTPNEMSKEIVYQAYTQKILNGEITREEIQRTPGLTLTDKNALLKQLDDYGGDWPSEEDFPGIYQEQEQIVIDLGGKAFYVQGSQGKEISADADESVKRAVIAAQREYRRRTRYYFKNGDSQGRGKGDWDEASRIAKGIFDQEMEAAEKGLGKYAPNKDGPIKNQKVLPYFSSQTSGRYYGPDKYQEVRYNYGDNKNYLKLSSTKIIKEEALEALVRDPSKAKANRIIYEISSLTKKTPREIVTELVEGSNLRRKAANQELLTVPLQSEAENFLNEVWNTFPKDSQMFDYPYFEGSLGVVEGVTELENNWNPYNWNSEDNDSLYLKYINPLLINDLQKDNVFTEALT